MNKHVLRKRLKELADSIEDCAKNDFALCVNKVDANRIRAMLSHERKLRRELTAAHKMLRKAGFTEIITTYIRGKS